MIKQWIESRQIKRMVMSKNDSIYLRIRQNKNRIERLTKADPHFFKQDIEQLKEENANLQSEIEFFI